jgi:hypothetical protein
MPVHNQSREMFSSLAPAINLPYRARGDDLRQNVANIVQSSTRFNFGEVRQVAAKDVPNPATGRARHG